MRIDARWLYSSAGTRWLGKRDVPEKTRRPAASAGTIPMCKNLGATQVVGSQPADTSLISPHSSCCITSSFASRGALNLPDGRLSSINIAAGLRATSLSGVELELMKEWVAEFIVIEQRAAWPAVEKGSWRLFRTLITYQLANSLKHHPSKRSLRAFRNGKSRSRVAHFEMTRPSDIKFHELFASQDDSLTRTNKRQRILNRLTLSCHTVDAVVMQDPVDAVVMQDPVDAVVMQDHFAELPNGRTRRKQCLDVRMCQHVVTAGTRDFLATLLSNAFDPYMNRWTDITLSVAEGCFTSRQRWFWPRCSDARHFNASVNPASLYALHRSISTGWQLAQEDSAP
ncbi:hypothetical protein PR048_027994 [Dryococelus australis]|uniref:Uncharacterized protein n=1 Tax=Dryococelus australis TaxID=614101 RepID=A0ABQ9GI02_9NEOP|nr:hypothetical protein PR048_027994 [Dryococelus australis]